MGVDILRGLSIPVGVVVSVLIAISIFLRKEMGSAMDKFIRIPGSIMVIMVPYRVFRTDPPIGSALKEAVLPSHIDWMIVSILVGGTVGGYISFAGAHRIIDAGLTGQENIGAISKGSINGLILPSRSYR